MWLRGVHLLGRMWIISEFLPWLPWQPSFLIIHSGHVVWKDFCAIVGRLETGDLVYPLTLQLFRDFKWLLSPTAAAAKSLQSCPTLCDPIDGSPPGSAIPGILQARTLKWVAISFSKAWKWKVKLLSPVRLLATPWTAAFQAHPSMGFSRQEYWSGVPLPSPISYY